MGAQPVPRSIARRFGPSALRTPANLVTALRFALTIPLLRIIVEDGVSWPAAVAWIMLACTDGLDGWLARRDGTTRSGAFLDPLADKFLVVGGFLALVARHDLSWIPVVLVVGREAGISAYRSLAARRGISLPARQLGKWKTFLQLCAVAAFVFPPTADVEWITTTVLWVAVALTIVSAIDILLTGWQEART
jgi:CDP-diacylglycerol--glycerol-3-phosphate 3-phosphatidyltransferase